MSPTKNVLQAIVNLKNNNNFQIILDWLKEEHIKAAIDSTKQWGEASIKIQGQSQAIEMLIERITTAEEKLEAIKTDRERPKGPIV